MQIQQQIKTALENAVKKLTDQEITINIERTRDSTHGDFATNIAFQLAKPLKQAPKIIAEKILQNLNKPAEIEKIEVAGNGFINFYLSSKAQHQVVEEILKQREQFGQRKNSGEKLHIEIVSSNPTGPLHVGHGRLAAYCDSMANILQATGFDVYREYYLNDAGRQMNILAVSVWLRYCELCNQVINMPAAAYQGEYVADIAREIKAQEGDKYNFNIVPMEKFTDPDKEIDAWINFAKQQLGKNFQLFFNAGLNIISSDIKQDLEEFDVSVDEYFSESSLMKNDFPACIEALKQKDTVYEKDGALWFRSTDFGDDKDRVLIRENGEPTYFATDIAYHWNKYNRGFKQIINVYGADHHGYMARMRAFAQAIGENAEQLRTALLQLVTLYRNKEKVPMSTRKGQFITLRQLRDEVGKDAARYFYIMRRIEQPLDFDLELAKSKNQDNPVYYVQYAHARICSVLKQYQEKFGELDLSQVKLNLLQEDNELELLRQLSRYPDTLLASAQQLDPFLLVQYLFELAALFHRYYNQSTFLVDDESLRIARMSLVVAIKEVLINGLKLIGVSHPEMM